jgi:acyl dehydratase
MTAAVRTVGPITRTDIVRYQGASGDFNPIHHDDEVARQVGYPTAFAVGMLPAGLLAAHAATLFGATAVRRFTARFREQVWPGESLTLAAQVTERSELAAGVQRVVVELTCTRDGGGVAVAATAEFEIPSDSDVLTIDRAGEGS